MPVSANLATQRNKPSRASQLSIEYLDTASLKPNNQNPRVHTDKQIHQIAQSITAFGFNVPLLVDRNLNVIAGHGRLLASKLLKLDSVPVIRLEHLTDAQRRAFLIADNRLTENASWNDRLLGEQLKILSEAEIDFSLEITGFEMAEIDIFIDGLNEKPDSEPDSADLLPEESKDTPISKTGDIWVLGKHRVCCGSALSATDFATLMNGRKAASMIADAPYNVPITGHVTGLGKTRHREFAMASGEMDSTQFTAFLNGALRNAASHSLSGSLHFVFTDWRHVGELLAAGTDIYGELKNLCVWAKDNAGMGSLYRSQHELVFVFKKGNGAHRNNIQLGAMGRYRTNVWHYPGISSFGRSTSEGDLFKLHPTVKPVALVADAILDCTARGEIVLDPFLGSGTTVIAAERTGRICFGMEIDPIYVDTIIRRWQAFSGKSAVHEASGKSFRELEENANAA